MQRSSAVGVAAIALFALSCKTRSPAPLPATDTRRQALPATVLADAMAPDASEGLDASAPAHALESDSDFIDVQTLLPKVQLDMRYAGTNNFVGKVIYPNARCLLRRPVALALQEAQRLLAAQRLQILVWDCYRPFSVQERFWELVPDRRYVAEPIRRNGRLARGSKHNRGAAVDLGLLELDGSPVPLPTDHDDFSARAHHDAKGIPAAARANAQKLRAAMESAGFQGIETEWWHFDHHSWRTFELSDEPL